MRNTLLIAFREFKMRVRNKTFLLSTFLLPIGIVIFYLTIFLFSINEFENYKIGVVDPNSLIFSKLNDTKSFNFIKLTSSEEANRRITIEKELSASLIVPNESQEVLNGTFVVNTYKKMGLATKEGFEKILKQGVEDIRYKYKSISKLDIDYIKQDLNISYLSEYGDQESEFREAMALGLGLGLGMLMYIVLTIYGSQVMRSVMEEKTNRIVEVIISSVKPIELMMGKIIGLGMVSIFQLSIWGGIFLLINIVFSALMGGKINMNNEMLSSSIEKMNQNPEMLNTLQEINDYNFLPVIIVFILLFIGGFLLYSSLFAAVGSAVNDDPQDSQALLLPIMMPIFISFIFLTKAINNPNGIEAIISSMVPFTSPIVMISRVAYGIPEGVGLIQLVVSLLILYATTFLFLWIASRIYRVGIIMYGKKASWKNIFSWIFIK